MSLATRVYILQMKNMVFSTQIKWMTLNSWFDIRGFRYYTLINWSLISHFLSGICNVSPKRSPVSFTRRLIFVESKYLSFRWIPGHSFQDGIFIQYTISLQKLRPSRHIGQLRSFSLTENFLGEIKCGCSEMREIIPLDLVMAPAAATTLPWCL